MHTRCPNQHTSYAFVPPRRGVLERPCRSGGFPPPPTGTPSKAKVTIVGKTKFTLPSPLQGSREEKIGRWGGRGPREGLYVAIGQLALLAADHHTPKCHPHPLLIPPPSRLSPPPNLHPSVSQVLSSGMIADLVNSMTLMRRFFAVPDWDLDYYTPVVNIADRLQREAGNSGWAVAVTGHSLGGGVATITGSMLGIPALAFSPPGLVRSRRKFRARLSDGGRAAVRLRRAAAYSVNFVPNRDPVPRSDAHFGLVQHTLCLQQDPLVCHLPELMVCDLLRHCGDGAGGRRFGGARFTSHWRRLVGAEGLVGRGAALAVVAGAAAVVVLRPRALTAELQGLGQRLWAGAWDAL